MHCTIHLNLDRLSECEVSLPDGDSVYTAVVFLKNNFNDISFRHIARSSLMVSDIINLHDEAGLDLNKIKKMVSDIKCGQSILEGQIPNVKLVEIDGRAILFDGHHTLLAYMLNRKKLEDIPHLLIKEGFQSSNAKAFFGKHSAMFDDGICWDDYVINWFAGEGKQICKRIRRNMGELFQSIRKPLLCCGYDGMNREESWPGGESGADRSK